MAYKSYRKETDFYLVVGYKREIRENFMLGGGMKVFLKDKLG